MTRIQIKNNGDAPYGAELVGGGYRFIQPGEERSIDAANVPAIELRDDVEFEVHADLQAPPASLVKKVAAPKPAARAPAKPRKTRRRKAPSR